MAAAHTTSLCWLLFFVPNAAELGPFWDLGGGGSELDIFTIVEPWSNPSYLLLENDILRNQTEFSHKFAHRHGKMGQCTMGHCPRSKMELWK